MEMYVCKRKSMPPLTPIANEMGIQVLPLRKQRLFYMEIYQTAQCGANSEGTKFLRFMNVIFVEGQEIICL
jgi:hypothetical protein